MRPFAATALLLLTACSPAAGDPARTALVEDIDSIAQLMLAVDVTPGLSIAVVHGEDTIVMKGYGTADVERGTPVTDQTVFAIGSVTKQFTAAAVMALVEDGRLSLESTVAEVLPEYRGPGRAATIHQLLNHTSGIPEYMKLDPRFSLRRMPSLTHDEMSTLLEGAAPASFPGEQWAYSNSGYYLLGRIVERITGTPYADHLRRTEIARARLENTGPCGGPEPSPQIAQGYELHLGKIAAMPVFRPNPVGSDGTLCSTARDLVRWARALEAGEVVSPASYARMIAPTPTDSATVPYGYGLGIRPHEGRAMVSHGGGLPGFRSMLAHYPEEDLTIAILANGPLPVGYFAPKIASLVLGVPWGTEPQAPRALSTLPIGTPTFLPPERPRHADPLLMAPTEDNVQTATHQGPAQRATIPEPSEG